MYVVLAKAITISKIYSPQLKLEAINVLEIDYAGYLQEIKVH